MDEKVEHASASPASPEAPEVEYTFSPGMLARLATLNVALAFTSYQSGFLYFLGRYQGGAHLHRTAIGRPMGLARSESGGLALATEAEIMRFEDALRPDQRANERFDACYGARTIHVTGSLDAHDVGVDEADRPIFVNTRFNCLATPARRASFELVWKPPFISGLLDGDKCHLNGLAMQDGQPAFVTAVSRSDVIDGWRDRRASGGVVIDVRDSRIVAEGLSMPHSPRVHEGELWLLNSGTGELGRVTPAGFVPRAFCPGFVRGLALIGRYAFVGLSKPRYKRFEGLALDDKLRAADADPWCGVQVIDLDTGGCVDWMRIDGVIAELYDVALLPGVACAMAAPAFSPEAAALVVLDRD